MSRRRRIGQFVTAMSEAMQPLLMDALLRRRELETAQRAARIEAAKTPGGLSLDEIRRRVAAGEGTLADLLPFKTSPAEILQGLSSQLMAARKSGKRLEVPTEADILASTSRLGPGAVAPVLGHRPEPMVTARIRGFPDESEPAELTLPEEASTLPGSLAATKQPIPGVRSYQPVQPPLVQQQQALAGQTFRDIGTEEERQKAEAQEAVKFREEQQAKNQVLQFQEVNPAGGFSITPRRFEQAEGKTYPTPGPPQFAFPPMTAVETMREGPTGQAIRGREVVSPQEAKGRFFPEATPQQQEEEGFYVQVLQNLDRLEQNLPRFQHVIGPVASLLAQAGGRFEVARPVIERLLGHSLSPEDISFLTDVFAGRQAVIEQKAGKAMTATEMQAVQRTYPNPSKTADVFARDIEVARLNARQGLNALRRSQGRGPYRSPAVEEFLKRSQR